MRISDWSSGVCSSDLSDLSDEVDVRDAVAAEGRRGCGNGLCERGGCGEKGGGGGQKGQRAKKDRKSVVWGKSVSVRVDLGGSRIIKKKKSYKIESDRKYSNTKTAYSFKRAQRN